MLDKNNSSAPKCPIALNEFDFASEADVPEHALPGECFTSAEFYAMPTVIGHHNITKGTKRWLDSPKRKELFGPLGVTNIRTFVDPQNPTRVAVLVDVPDMDAMMKAMQSKEAADAMAFDGVVPESLVVLIESER
jgi:hypothetical protein